VVCGISEGRGIRDIILLTQSHSHTDDLTYDFNFTVGGNSWRHRGKRMRLQDYFFFAKRTPATGIVFSRLDKINRALVLRSPSASPHPVPGFIHLNAGTRQQNWIHGQILGADVTVTVVDTTV
jgi:hypothetical protein